MQKPMKSLFLAIMLILLTVSAAGAIIKGTIFDMSLEEMKDSIVEINTAPKQMIVAKDGTYSFNVPEGNYTITARNKDQAAEENITISSNGEFTLDMILMPQLEEETLDQELIPEDELQDYETYLQEIEGEKSNTKLFGRIIFLVLLLILIGGIIFHIKRKKRDKRRASRTVIVEDAEKAIAYLKKQGGRALQKDIRKNLAVSEAKASLLVDELVAKGRVEKIKKGRGNIIILKN